MYSSAEDVVLWPDDDEFVEFVEAADPAAATVEELLPADEDEEPSASESLEIWMHDIVEREIEGAPEFVDLEPSESQAGALVEAPTLLAGSLDAVWQHVERDEPELGQRPLDLAGERIGALLPERRDPIRAPFWGAINTMFYALGRALRGMGQSPMVQLIAVGTMAVCMLLLATTLLLFRNAQAVATRWGIDAPVTVYMQPGADAHEVAALRDKLAALPEVARAEHVTPAQALARLDAGVGEHPELLAGIDASALPDSIELSLVAGVEPGFADALADRVRGMAGVEEVAALGPWVQEAERMLTTFEWLALGVGLLVTLACLAIVWSTIRLGVFARRSELDILRLVGGTSRFVRGPFVVEGVLQGVLGTGLALAGLWLAFELVHPFLEQGLALMFAAGSIRFFSPLELGLALAFGGLLGLLGARAAVAHYAEA
jgi:cell division transport system permease protein